MTLFLGVDGGGSTLRVVLTDADMNVLAQLERGAANPSSIGKEAAAALLNATIHETLASAGKTVADVAAIALGIAGTARLQSWVLDVATAILPDTLIVPSTDFEIALVGARGERFGVLVLAGTGSVAFGVNRTGESVQVGGWGYLLGDEGSGYRIGMEALKVITRVADQRYQRASEASSTLPARLMKALNFAAPHDVIAWIYSQPRVPDVARLAQIVLDAAAQGDDCAREIIAEAAHDLAALVNTIRQRLHDDDLPVAFAGGLLTTENLLSAQLAQQLGLQSPPQPRYPPVIGAALLAKLMWNKTNAD